MSIEELFAEEQLVSPAKFCDIWHIEIIEEPLELNLIIRADEDGSTSATLYRKLTLARAIFFLRLAMARWLTSLIHFVIFNSLKRRIQISLSPRNNPSIQTIQKRRFTDSWILPFNRLTIIINIFHFFYSARHSRQNRPLLCRTSSSHLCNMRISSQPPRRRWRLTALLWPRRLWRPIPRLSVGSYQGIQESRQKYRSLLQMVLFHYA